MTTADTLLHAEVDEVPEPATMEPMEEENEATNAAQNGGEEPSEQGQAKAEHQEQQELPGTNHGLPPPVALATSVLPAGTVESHTPIQVTQEQQHAHYEPFNYAPAPGLPEDSDQVMKDGGTDLTANGLDTNAGMEGMNHLKHEEEHPSEQEMRAMEHAVMAEVSVPGDGTISAPPLKKRRTGSKRSAVRPWNDMLYELLKYRMAHGHVMVPFKTGGDLGKWVSQQRTQYANVQKALRDKQNLNGNEFLIEERMRVLTSIGFVWDVVQADNDARWKKRYDELKDYRLQHGHCNVPQSTDLGKWVKVCITN